MFFALLLPLLGFDAQGRGRAQQKAFQADGFAGLGAPAVFATRQAFERLVDLVQQLLFPLQQAQLPLALLLGGTDIGDVAAGIGLAQLGEFIVDARLQLGTLGQQQHAEELLLGVVHVRVGRLGQQLDLGQYGHRDHGKSAGLF